MSEQYIVSARKYRPQSFDTVIGQEHITTTLKNAIKNGHLAHAYLFTGPRGVGKTTCARILAKTINCTEVSENIEACGHCENCIASKDNSSFNIFELDAASNNSVDDIRALTEQVRFAPQMGKYKVYIIDEVHMLSTGAFNAFLKTLEEPPPYAIFILATTEKHKILPTILSRCQIFDFKRIQTDDTVKHLQQIIDTEQINAEESALHIIAQQSEGCMRDALSIMDRIVSFTNGNLTYANTIEHLNMLDATTYFQLTDWFLSRDYPSVLLTIEDLLSRGFEGNIILAGLADHFRNLLLSRDLRMAKILDIPAAHKKNYFEKVQIIPESFIINALKLVGDAEIQYNSATNKRLHLELCMIKLSHLNDTIQLTQFLQAEEIKKKISQFLIDNPELQPLNIALDFVATASTTQAEISSESFTTNVTQQDILVEESLETIIKATNTASDEINNTSNKEKIVKEDINIATSESSNASNFKIEEKIAFDDVHLKSLNTDSKEQHPIASNQEPIYKERATPTKPKAKLSKDFLNTVRNKNKEIAEEEKEVLDIDTSMIDTFLKEYLNALPPGKDLIKSQINALDFHEQNGKEIIFTAYNTIQYSALTSIIPDLLQLITSRTNNHSIRIVPILELKDDGNKRKVKNKTEIFEDMKSSNQGLAALVEMFQLRPKIIRPFNQSIKQTEAIVNTQKSITLDDNIAIEEDSIQED